MIIRRNFLQSKSKKIARLLLWEISTRRGKTFSSKLCNITELHRSFGYFIFFNLSLYSYFKPFPTLSHRLWFQFYDNRNCVLHNIMAFTFHALEQGTYWKKFSRVTLGNLKIPRDQLLLLNFAFHLNDIEKNLSTNPVFLARNVTNLFFQVFFRAAFSITWDCCSNFYIDPSF